MAVLKDYIKAELDNASKDFLEFALTTEKFHKAFFKYANKYVGRNAIIEPRFIAFGRDNTVLFGLLCDTQDAKDLEKFANSSYSTFIAFINLSLKEAGAGKYECTKATIAKAPRFDSGLILVIQPR